MLKVYYLQGFLRKIPLSSWPSQSIGIGGRYLGRNVILCTGVQRYLLPLPFAERWEGWMLPRGTTRNNRDREAVVPRLQ